MATILLADSKGKTLKKGDEVWVKCKVVDLSPDFMRNNVTVQVIGKKDDEFKNKFVLTAHQCQKIEKEE